MAYSAQGLNDKDIDKSLEEWDTESPWTVTQLQPDLLSEVHVMHNMVSNCLFSDKAMVREKIFLCFF